MDQDDDEDEDVLVEFRKADDALGSSPGGFVSN